IQAFRHSGIQAFRHSGIQAFRHSGIQAFRHSGILNNSAQSAFSLFNAPPHGEAGASLYAINPTGV
ncbi:MAG: hypothetical protein LBK60_11445, partial [Verrucomicrobiales bacterium]|nr:hypothetical protein [Verrucomicrobiales bacterium]